jgi:histidinol-phosphatase (PHP family)
MLEGAIDKGVETLAITDHHDPGYLDPEFPFLLDFEAYHKGLEDALTNYAGKLDIRTGLEIGIMEGQFEEANKVVNAYDYDIIIGSFHCLRQDDLYRYDFTDVDGPAMVEDFYTYVLKCLKGYTNYDIVGHLSILDRYIGKLYDYTPYSDIIDEILRTVIYGGKGIEINTSSFKYGTGTWLPRESILKRYHQLGGEILTFGSDAHEPKYYMYHFDDAVELAKSIGFKYYCKFKDRQPEFLTL